MAYSNYMGWTRSGLVDGDPASIRLTRTAGGTYTYPGIFRSRVLDKGVAGAWHMISTDVDNSIFEFQSLKGEISADHPGLVALYHLNNDNFLDQVSGNNGTPVNFSPIWTTASKLGSHALFINANRHFVTVNSTLLQHAGALTISAWVRRQGNQLQNSGIVYSQWSQGDLGFFFSSNNGVTFRVTKSGENIFLGAGAPPDGEWTLFTGTWSGSDGRASVYRDGELVNSISASNVRGALGQTSPLLGGRNARTGIHMEGWLDEIAVWNRELSPDEVRGLFLSLSSVDVRVRSGETPVLSGEFVGPDGTVASFYRTGASPIRSGGNFNPFHRYVQYQLDVFSNATGAETPSVNAVKLATTDGVIVYDSTLAQLERAANVALLTNYPGHHATPHLGLARRAVGDFELSGTFRSPVLDGGEGASWQMIAWDMPPELATDTEGLGGNRSRGAGHD